MDLHKFKTAWLTVNRSCNLRCSWCYGTSSGFKSSSDMDYEVAMNIVLLLKDTGIKTLVIIGGEPTIWKHLFQLNDLCNDLGIRTSLITNALKFHSENFWLDYLKHPNTHMEISLKAFDEQCGLIVTGRKNYFRDAKIGIQRIISKFKTPINIVYSTLIENNLLKMVSTAVELGASFVDVCICKPFSINNKFIAPFTVTFDKMVTEISNDYEKMVEITKGKLSFALNTPLCIWPEFFIQDVIAKKRIGTGCQFQHRSGVVFDTDGSIFLCNSMSDCHVGRYGIDFIQSESLFSLLNSEKVNAIYNHINSYPSKKCMNCDLFPNCRGGCPLMWTVYKAEDIVHPIKLMKGGQT